LIKGDAEGFRVLNDHNLSVRHYPFGYRYCHLP
jgi:hypothetical protein